ncbi:MAG: ABC transporter permease, partial [Burkholderiaceae bacterium]|nr:ABC transporter permease [Burkholderiaceae bacterium]
MKSISLDRSLGWAVTLTVAAFLIGPVVLSVLAGLTKNYF